MTRLTLVHWCATRLPEGDGGGCVGRNSGGEWSTDPVLKPLRNGHSTFRTILAIIPPRILAAMFEALRATTLLGLLAAGIPALVFAQATGPGVLSPGQTTEKPAASAVSQVSNAKPVAPGGQETGTPHPLLLDEKHRPITAGGFVKTGPVVLIDDSEKAGLTHWTHKMGTPAKSYIIETKGSGVGLIDYDNSGWLSIYVVNGSTVDALTGKETPPHAALFHNNHDGTFTDVAAKAGVTNDRWGTGVAIADYDNDGWPDILVSNVG